VKFLLQILLYSFTLISSRAGEATIKLMMTCSHLFTEVSGMHSPNLYLNYSNGIWVSSRDVVGRIGEHKIDLKNKRIEKKVRWGHSPRYFLGQSANWFRYQSGQCEIC